MTKYSLMIGLNYKQTTMELNGCINDIHAMKDLTVNYLDFKSENIVIMHDKLPTDSEFFPNKKNIATQLSKIVSKCKKGDICFLHYSGHGVKSDIRECIYPTDAVGGAHKNYICEDEITNSVSKLPKDVTLFILSDSCNTKSIVDFSYVVKSDPTNPNQYTLKKRTQNVGMGAEMVCLTATSGTEKAYDVIDKDGKAYGVLTNIFCTLVKRYISEKKPLYYLDLLTEIAQQTKRYKQTPMLSFSNQACMTCLLPLMYK